MASVHKGYRNHFRGEETLQLLCFLRHPNAGHLANGLNEIQIKSKSNQDPNAMHHNTFDI